MKVTLLTALIDARYNRTMLEKEANFVDFQPFPGLELEERTEGADGEYQVKDVTYNLDTGKVVVGVDARSDLETLTKLGWKVVR